MSVINEDEVLDIYRSIGALLEGHFILSSGLHSRMYLQSALVCSNANIAEELCINLANNHDLYKSVVSAKKFTEKSLVLAPKLGLKYGPVGHQSFFK